MTPVRKTFIDTLSKIDYSRHTYDVFTDFLKLASLSIMQSVRFDENREKSYLEIIGRYKSGAAQTFGMLLGVVAEGLESERGDFLGDICMDSNFGNTNLGQFFTPYNVCLMMAELQLSDFNSDARKIVTFNEPACGGGAMVIACCEIMKKLGFDYQRYSYWLAQDLSEIAFRMAYIQLSLMGVPAHVVWMNTLTLEQFAVYETPMLGIHLVYERLQAQEKREHVEPEHEVPSYRTEALHQVQLDLFG